ncbi:MAG: PKD domain containing protein [uncultured Aureispira sp.]|uniref:PKD domain containing protein n=1 Tax=uncultured Aureispira sp. TaxID=1331704 RepID=A0A6S6UCK4_9BACT|nr:MAG: PKD domain containing protein [uncultured Aureispira sp.]
MPLYVSATHMVGGEINYRCLGNDRYEIMVTVFRDCDTGVPWFDSPASIGIFDINDSLLYDLRLQLKNNDTLDLNLTDPCLVAPPNVCIHTTTYIDTVTLPFQVGGYQVVYQRCCRNQDIVNIVAPTSTGATYSSYISEEALLGCNGSARFVEWPPVYVCAGVPIVYDHSALDPDGDSIVYELCTPFTGATPSQSRPQPPNNPPYNPVTWQPPYSIDNMLGGPDSLVIDPATGLLTGTPDIIGVFVVGVCAKEYRNGVLISTTRRDFQYVVGVCGRLVSSAFFAPEIQCDNSLVVNFQNNSASLGTGFVWSFGDPATNATSTFSNPAYIYPDTGRYTITLIADPGTLCADTATQEIYLQYESIHANFDVTTASCTDSFFLDVTDLTIDSISTIAQWDWDFGNGLTDTVPYPSTFYDASGMYVINLNVVAANGCTATYSDTLILDLPVIFSEDSIGICAGDSSIILNPGGNPNHVYQWSPAIGLSSTTVASPIASPLVPTTYFVTVTAPNGVDTCVLEKSISVVLPPPLTLDVLRDTITCQDSISILAFSNTAQIIEWAVDPLFNTILFTGDSIRIPITSVVRLFVRATDFAGCSVIDTVDVFKRITPITVNWAYNLLTCDSTFTVQFTDQTIDNSGGALRLWSWDFGDSNSSNQQHPTHTYQQSGNYMVVLDVETIDGCIGRFQDMVTVSIPQLTSGDTVGVCQGNNSVQLNQNGNASLQYIWSPAASLNNATAVSPIATPLVPTTYTVTITAINGGDTCINIEQVHVNFPPPVTVTIPAVTVYCGSTVDLTANSPTAIFYEWAGDPSFNLILGTGNPYAATPMTFPYAGYYVRATDAYGCTATAFALVQQNPVPINVDFSYQSLGCSDTIAIQFTDLTSDTTASPIASWLWTTSDGQSTTQQNPVLTFTQSQATSVSLQVTLANGCTGILTDTLMLNIASLTTDSTVILCNGDSVLSLNPGGNPNLNYQWSPAAFLSSTSAASPIASVPSTPFTYTVSITGQSGIDTCIAVHNITVVQAPPITIEVPKDTVVCTGSFNVQANISNAVQTDWSFSPSFNPIAISNVNNFFVGLPGPPYDLFLYVRATDQYGCTAEDTVKVYRRNVIIPTGFITQVNACEDTLDVSFTNTTTFPSGTQLQGYVWNFGNGTTTYTTNGLAQYPSSGVHVVRLTATATNGCTGTFVDTLDYNLPSLNSADSVGLCTLDSIQLNIGGNPNLMYQWSPATNLTNPTIASPIARPTTTTLYTVTVTAPNALDTCVQVHTVLVGVDRFVFEAMSDTVLCVNQVALKVNAPDAASVEWSLDRNFNLIIGRGDSLVTNVNDARWFYVRGESNFGCQGLDSVFVHYRGNDIPINFTMTPVNCGDSLVVQFQDISGDTLIRNWNWDLGNGQTSTAQNPITTYYADSSYTIDLQIQIIGNCTGQVSKSLTAQIPVLEVPNNHLVTCGSDSISLMIQTNPNLSYLWSPGLGLSDSTVANPRVLPTVNTSYTVRVYGYSNFGGILDTCWVEDSIFVTLQPAPVVQIQGDTLTCDTSINLTAISPQTGTYGWSSHSDFQTILDNDALFTAGLSNAQQTFYVQVQDSFGCFGVDSILLNRRSVQLNLDSTYVSCNANPIALSVSTNNILDTLQYTWSPNPIILTGQGTDSITVPGNTAINLSVVGINQFGCMDSVETSIRIAPPLSLHVPLDTILCQPNLTLTANSNQNVQYTWSNSLDFNPILAQNPSLQTNVVNNQHVYYVQIEDTLGCIEIDSVLVEYYPVEITLDSAALICTTEPIQLLVTNLNRSDSLSYQWTSTGTIVSGQGTDTILVAPVVPTNYTVVAQNQYGCIARAQTLVDVSSSNPQLSIQADQDTLYAGNGTQLLATVQAGYVYTWNADPTLSEDSIYNPIARPEATTTYYLTITDALGCITTDSIIIYVNLPICDEPNVFVPNAFSPDGDGYNDVIYVEGSAITAINFIIYNRWGEQVFQSNDKSIGWDGKFKGKDCLPDVYGYYMQCKCLDGNELVKKGNITLLR